MQHSSDRAVLSTYSIHTIIETGPIPCNGNKNRILFVSFLLLVAQHRSKLPACQRVSSAGCLDFRRSPPINCSLLKFPILRPRPLRRRCSVRRGCIQRAPSSASRPFAPFLRCQRRPTTHDSPRRRQPTAATARSAPSVAARGVWREFAAARGKCDADPRRRWGAHRNPEEPARGPAREECWSLGSFATRSTATQNTALIVQPKALFHLLP